MESADRERLKLEELMETYKRALAKRVWALPSLSEGEKEILFKTCLDDLMAMEREVIRYHEDVLSQQVMTRDENDILRSIMGVEKDELRANAVGVAQELNNTLRRMRVLEDELQAVKRQLGDSATENVELRKLLKQSDERLERFQFGQIKEREGDVNYFSNQHELLKNNLSDLQTRIKNLKELFLETNEKLLLEKQDEISLLQKKLLSEMESALQRKQELVWTEEALFAKGVAQRVRNALVSAQGQLYLTLERMGLMDPDTKNKASLLKRFKMLSEGSEELLHNFQLIQTQFQNVTKTLDDYLHLIGLRDIARDPVDLRQLVDDMAAELYRERRPLIHFEVSADDPLPTIPGDAELLKFCVRALIKNAEEALPQGAGKIAVMIRHVPDRGVIELTVRDSGKGIPAFLLPKLYQPFFTTKEGRQGLSLSRSKRYVELHGGQLDLIKSGEQGTTFQIQLPTTVQATFIPFDPTKVDLSGEAS